MLTGDIKEIDAIWSVEDGKLVTTGLIQSKELPISELLSINKTEEINHVCHVDFRFNRGVSFTASMQDSVYSTIYDQYKLDGNHPTGIPIPTLTPPLSLAETIKENLLYIIIGGLIFYIVTDKQGTELLTARLNKAEAISYCNLKIADTSIYGAEFPFSYSSSVKFYTDENRSGYRLIKNFKLKDAFDTYAKANAICEFNVAGALTGLTVNGNKII